MLQLSIIHMAIKNKYKDFESKNLAKSLDLIKSKTLDADQQKLYDYLIETKSSWLKMSGVQDSARAEWLIGPFNVFLYGPEMARAFNTWAEKERAESTMSDDLRTLIINTIGINWNISRRIDAEDNDLLAAGASTAAEVSTPVAAILTGEALPELNETEAIVYKFTSSLVNKKNVHDDLYNEATSILDEKTVADMLNLIGLYMAVAALINEFAVPQSVPELV